MYDVVSAHSGDVGPGGVRFDAEREPVYALMVTGKDSFHAGLARNAILSFLAQSYGNRFLIVVNDGAYRFACPGVPAERVVQVQIGAKRPLGALRNESLDRVPEGAVWVQWDDDDWHHPELIAAQYETLAPGTAEASFLCRQVKYAFSRNAGWADAFAGGFAGTLMARKRPGLRYPDLPRGEDSAFTVQLKQSCRFVTWGNPPHYYVRFIHGHNTWPNEHFGLSRRPADQWIMPAESAAYLRTVLPMYEPLFRSRTAPVPGAKLPVSPPSVRTPRPTQP